MIVVSNTTPIYNLEGIGRLTLLEALYREILVPGAVVAELQRLWTRAGRTPMPTLPPWIHAETVATGAFLDELSYRLDSGEAETLALAMARGAELVLMDERAGRRLAAKHGFRRTGILGILLEAKLRGVIPEVRPSLDALSDFGLWIGESLYQAILVRADESR